MEPTTGKTGKYARARAWKLNRDVPLQATDTKVD